MRLIPCTLIVALMSTATFAKISLPKTKPTESIQTAKSLLQDYKVPHGKNKKALLALKKKTLKRGAKAVPTLVKVMKGKEYPEGNRWVATFLLGKIMGKKASPFISKFMEHPNWVLRMAALKTLLSLSDKGYQKNYVRLLKDESLIIRNQALETIRKLGLASAAPNVWAMLYDKKNYYETKKTIKRGEIIRKVVRTVGDLKFVKAKEPLLKMIAKKRYKDIYQEIDYALTQITGMKSPKGKMSIKKLFWSRIALSEVKL